MAYSGHIRNSRTHSTHMYREQAILYRSACPLLGYAECVFLVGAWIRFPPASRARKLTDIYYRVGLLSSPPRRHDLVILRNNLIPYSRGGCRPWRIEWNKIKPRIPRVLWRGSVPYPSRKSRISTSAACARVYIHTVSFCSSFCFTFHSLISLFSLFCALHLCPPHGFLFVTALLPMIAWCLAVFQDTVLLRINDVFMLTGLGEIIN